MTADAHQPRRALAADTSLASEARQLEVWRSMTPAQKFAALEDLMQMAVAVAEAGIRLRHPGADEREVFLRRVARSLDRRTMILVYGWDPEQHR